MIGGFLLSINSCSIFSRFVCIKQNTKRENKYPQVIKYMSHDNRKENPNIYYYNQDYISKIIPQT